MSFIKNYLFIIFIFYFPLYAENIKNVSLQLQWKHQFQFAGYYVAKEKGFYQDAGFDVDIKEFKFGMNVPNEIVNKKSTFGVGRPTLIVSRSNGDNVVLLASIFQSSPNIWLAIKNRSINTLEDFRNKKVMVTGDAKEDTTIMSMVFSKGIQLKDLDVIEHSFNINDLISGKTDLMSSYISNEPFLLKEKGYESQIFDPKDYGFDFYNDILFTTEDEVNSNPEDVKKFTQASIRGWKYAFNNIEESVNLIYEKYNTQHKSKEALIYEANELKKLAYYKTDELGQIEKSKIEKIYDYYKLMGFTKKDISFDNFVFNYDKSTFLTKEETSYLKEKNKITMCIDPSWMPFESYNKNGNHIGMTADYFKLFENKINTKFETIKTSSWSESLAYLKEKKCDILSLAKETSERKKFANFTEPYLSVPLVVATRLNAPYINDIKDLSGKLVGFPRGYFSLEYFRTNYPLVKIVEVNNVQEGLEKLENEEIFAFVDTASSIAYESHINNFSDIKIAGKLLDDWKLSVAVRNDDLILLNILNKAIKSLTEEKREEIINKWVSIKYAEHLDYILIFKSVFPFLIILSILIYFFNEEKKLKNKIEESNMKLLQAYEDLEKLAITDKLTKLYNRHKIDSILDEEKKRADRYGLNFGVMILDIDYFKKVNDNYGHHVGDEILKEFSFILKSNSRETDIVGRWGGEEFIIIIPQIDHDAIVHFANNLRIKIKTHKFKFVGEITVSIGISLYIKDEETLSVLNRADEALYISKNSGRNCVNCR